VAVLTNTDTRFEGKFIVKCCPCRCNYAIKFGRGREISVKIV